MLGHIKDATVYTWKGVVVFFIFFRYIIIALSVWLRGFAAVDTWFFKFFLLKAGIILIGYYVTPIPLWLLVIFSFAPPGIIFGIYFITFLGALTHFG